MLKKAPHEKSAAGKSRILSSKFIRDFIESSCGICLGPEKIYLLADRWPKILVEEGCKDFRKFTPVALTRSQRRLRVRMLTPSPPKETYWFRDQHPPLRLLQEKSSGNFAPIFFYQGRFKKDSHHLGPPVAPTGKSPIYLPAANRAHKKGPPATLVAQIGYRGHGYFSLHFFFVARKDAMMHSMSRGPHDFFRQKYFTACGKVWTISERSRKWYLSAT